MFLEANQRADETVLTTGINIRYTYGWQGLANLPAWLDYKPAAKLTY